MKIFKITNVTNLIGKRDYMFNATLDIEYIIGMKKEVIKLKPNETIYLKTDSLGLSVHKLRVNGFVHTTEISEDELNEFLDKSKPKVVEKPILEVKKDNVKKIAPSNKKKFGEEE